MHTPLMAAAALSSESKVTNPKPRAHSCVSLSFTTNASAHSEERKTSHLQSCPKPILDDGQSCHLRQSVAVVS